VKRRNKRREDFNKRAQRETQKADSGERKGELPRYGTTCRGRKKIKKLVGSSLLTGGGEVLRTEISYREKLKRTNAMNLAEEKRKSAPCRRA